jgi:hypothetical protein
MTITEGLKNLASSNVDADDFFRVSISTERVWLLAYMSGGLLDKYKGKGFTFDWDAKNEWLVSNNENGIEITLFPNR